MSQTISQYDGVMSIRLHGRLNANELYQEMRKSLDGSSTGPVIVFVDFSLVSGTLGLAVKQVLFRGLQHHNVTKVGFFGAAVEIQKELADVIPVLSRVRPVFADLTETDLRAKMGLIEKEPERKLSGMLKYLQQKPA
jgi:hypothetical protein